MRGWPCLSVHALARCYLQCLRHWESRVDRLPIAASVDLTQSLALKQKQSYAPIVSVFTIEVESRMFCFQLFGGWWRNIKACLAGKKNFRYFQIESYLDRQYNDTLSVAEFLISAGVFRKSPDDFVLAHQGLPISSIMSLSAFAFLILSSQLS